jgi:hypothetical protein
VSSLGGEVREACLCACDGGLYRIVSQVILRMALAGSSQLTTARLEPLHSDGLRSVKNHLDERRGAPDRDIGERLDETETADELRNDDVVATTKLRFCQRDRQFPRNQLRLVDHRPLPERGPKTVDVDQERQRMIIDIPTPENRLANTRRTVEMNKQRDGSIVPGYDRSSRGFAGSGHTGRRSDDD